MSKLSNEQKLAKIIEVKNERIADATKALRISFSILNSVRNNLSSEIDIDEGHYLSMSDALLTMTDAFMNLIETQTLEKYWKLDK
jgi:hypothetical protein